MFIHRLKSHLDSVDHGKFKPQIAAIELPNPKTKKIGTDKNNKKNEKIAPNENIKEIGLYKFQLKLLKVSSNENKPIIIKPTGKDKKHDPNWNINF